MGRHVDLYFLILSVFSEFYLTIEVPFIVKNIIFKTQLKRVEK